MGRWLNTLVLTVGGDLQRIDTTWEFGPDGDCNRSVVTLSIQSDRRWFSDRDCRYSVRDNQLIVRYDDATADVTFSFSFPGFSPDLLLIDDFAFDRVL